MVMVVVVGDGDPKLETAAHRPQQTYRIAEPPLGGYLVGAQCCCGADR